MSFQQTAKTYRAMIHELGMYIQSHFPKDVRSDIRFIDFGGGFVRKNASAFYPEASMRGNIIQTANDYFFTKTRFKEKYYIEKSVSLVNYAKGISQAMKTFLDPILSCDYYCEPGRILADTSMHLLLRVVAVKPNNVVITDAGTSMMGWQIYTNMHLPVLNLTHPSLHEISCSLYGSLCTPSDLWSKYCYGEKIKEGDYLLIPYQGSYTYSFAQNFIKPIPKVVML